MIQLDEFEEAVNSVVEKANKLRSETTLEIRRNAPFIVRERLSHQLVAVAKLHPNQIPKEVPEMLDILIALKVLDANFPELTNKTNLTEK